MRIGQQSDRRRNIKKTVAFRRITAAGLSFAGVCALPWMLPIDDGRLGYTNSIVTVFLFLSLVYLVDKILTKEFSGGWARWIWPGCFGVVFSFCMVFGTQLDSKESVPFKNGSMWISIAFLALIFSFTVRYLWDMLGMIQFTDRKIPYGTGERLEPDKAEVIEQERMVAEGTKKKTLSSFWTTAGGILLCYIPVFLAVYPGFFVYDAQDEYLQVVTRNFSTHHPLLHVLLLGGIIQLIYKITGSYNLGIACYTVLQMIVMSGIFAWCVEKMKARGAAKGERIFLTLYFGLCPVLVMFVLCSAKDGLFTGMLLMVVVLLQELCRDGKLFFQKKGTIFLFVAASLGMMLFRHNGFYAFLVLIPFLVIYLKRESKKLAILMAVIIGLYVLISNGMGRLLHADSSENQEMLTVPISQLARVWQEEISDGLLEKEEEVLYSYLSPEALGRYTPKVSDGVKINFNNEAYEADKTGFWKLWWKWGLQHPFTYLNAWFMTSYGFWYPNTVIDVYRGNTVFTFTYGDSSYFGYEVEQPGFRESKIPWLNEWYRRMSLEIAQQKIPVISMLFSPGFLFWVWAFCLGFLCYRKCWASVMPFLLPALCWLTVILGPTYLVRYVVFLWALFPLLIWEAFGFCSKVQRHV